MPNLQFLMVSAEIHEIWDVWYNILATFVRLIVFYGFPFKKLKNIKGTD